MQPSSKIQSFYWHSDIKTSRLFSNTLKKPHSIFIIFFWQGVVWPKFTWSKLCFFSWSKVLIMKVSYFITWSNYFTCFQLIKSFINVIFAFKKFWSSAKKQPTDFGSWSKVLIMVFYAFKKFRLTAKIRRFFFGSWSNVLLAKK